jgi:hypothetical protein
MPAVCGARWTVSRKLAVLPRTGRSPEVTPRDSAQIVINLIPRQPANPANSTDLVPGISRLTGPVSAAHSSQARRSGRLVSNAR